MAPGSGAPRVVLSVRGAGSAEVNGEYLPERIDLGQLGTVARIACFRKRQEPPLPKLLPQGGEKEERTAILLVLFSYTPSMCCFWDPGCCFQQVSVLGRRRSRCPPPARSGCRGFSAQLCVQTGALVRAEKKPPRRSCWKCNGTSWTDCMGGFSNDKSEWSVEEVLYLSRSCSARSARSAPEPPPAGWCDARLALLNGEGSCNGASPPPRLEIAAAAEKPPPPLAPDTVDEQEQAKHLSAPMEGRAAQQPAPKRGH